MLERSPNQIQDPQIKSKIPQIKSKTPNQFKTPNKIQDPPNQIQDPLNRIQDPPSWPGLVGWLWSIIYMRTACASFSSVRLLVALLIHPQRSSGPLLLYVKKSAVHSHALIHCFGTIFQLIFELSLKTLLKLVFLPKLRPTCIATF